MYKFIYNLFIIYITIELSFCSTLYSAKDIIFFVDKYLDNHAAKSYYVTIDPNHFLDEIDHKVLAKYQNLIFDKYGLVTIIIVANGFQSYGNGLLPFINQFFKEFRKTFDLQRLNCIISVISISEHRIAIDVTNKMKHIFRDNVLRILMDKMLITFDQNHLFLTIYNFLKNIEKGQKQYDQNGIITDL